MQENPKKREPLGYSAIHFVWLYFALIPIFAIIYTIFTPADFVHSNIHMEISFQEEIAEREQVIQEELSHLFGEITTEGENSALYIDTRSFAYNEGIFFYEVYFECPVNSSSCQPVISCTAANQLDDYAIECSLKNNELLQYFSLDRELWKTHRNNFRRFTSEEISLENELVFHLTNSLLLKESPNSQVHGLVRNLNNYEQLISGKQISPNLNVFVRMLYFSVVTITTLGFGDIAPISTIARLLVTLESVLGILLIGLFFNALAHKARGN